MYYFLSYKKAVGCPFYLGALLHETQEAAVQERPMSYRWHYASPGEELDALPAELWTIAKTKKYDFDVKSDSGGFVVSALFLDLMSRHNVGCWEKAKLHIQLKKGDLVSDKQYYLVRQQDKYKHMASDVVDLKKSKIILRKDGTVKKMKSLVFTDRQDRDLFMLNDDYEYLFCSEKFAAAGEALELKGVQFTPVDNLEPDDLTLI